MSCRYMVVSEQYMGKARSRTAYGIAAVEEYDGHIIVMQSIPDISPEFLPIARLVQICNRLHLEPIHLNEIVEDFFVDQI